MSSTPQFACQGSSRRITLVNVPCGPPVSHPDSRPEVNHQPGASPPKPLPCPFSPSPWAGVLLSLDAALPMPLPDKHLVPAGVKV